MESNAKAILNIPLSPLNKEDSIIWHHDTKGFFSVKSAYRLGIQVQASNEASISHNGKMEALWDIYWKTPVPPKIRVCRWTIFHDILPTRTNLIKRGMEVNPLCILCKTKLETITHLLWECNQTKGMWAQFFPLPNSLFLMNREAWSAADYCEFIWRGGDTDQLTEMNIKWSTVISWQIWKYRNELLHGN